MPCSCHVTVRSTSEFFPCGRKKKQKNCERLRERNSIHMKLNPLLLWLCVIGCCFANEAVVSLNELLASNNLTGVASFWKGNAQERVGSGVHGYSDPYESRLVEVDTRYPVASNTKLYAALSLYQLQEAGKLNVSDSIADYLTAEDFVNFGLSNVTRYCPLLPGSAKQSHSSSCLR